MGGVINTRPSGVSRQRSQLAPTGAGQALLPEALHPGGADVSKTNREDKQVWTTEVLLHDRPPGRHAMRRLIVAT